MFLQGNFQQAFINTFVEIDKYDLKLAMTITNVIIFHREFTQKPWGGSTAACALLVGNTLAVANLGDSEIVLAYPLLIFIHYFLSQS